MFAPYMDVFLIDSWDLNKQEKQINFLRRAVSISGEIFSFEFFHQTSCRLIGGICSTWVVCSHTLSGIVNPLEKNSETTCHHIRWTCSTYKIFTDKRYHPFIRKFIVIVTAFKMKEKDWQLMRYFFLWLVLPFIVALAFYGNFRRREKFAKIFAANFWPLFHLHCYRQFASIFTFISDYFVKLLLFKCFRSIETRS